MILISVDSLTRVGATRRFQFISYWLTGRRMEVRIVQINGVKSVENGRVSELTSCNRIARSANRIRDVCTQRVTTDKPTIMAHWKLPWTVRSHSERVQRPTCVCVCALLSVCTLVIYAKQLLNDCGDATRHTIVFTTAQHAPCSAIDAKSFVIIKCCWIWTLDTFMLAASLERTVSDRQRHERRRRCYCFDPFFSLVAFIRPAESSGWLIAQCLFQCTLFAERKRNRKRIRRWILFSLSLSMMMSSSWCIHRTMLSLSTEACSNLEQQ